MIVNNYAIEVYNKHSARANSRDKKQRVYYFDIENLESDYKILIKTLKPYDNICFDFVASCLQSGEIILRVFNSSFTGRFGILQKVDPKRLKSKLIKDNFIRMPKSKKSGPLCLYDDFSEPNSAFRFRLFLPLRELWDVLKIIAQKYGQKG